MEQDHLVKTLELLTGTSKITKLLEIAIRNRCLYENSDPDVGMGPQGAWVVKLIFDEAEIDSNLIDPKPYIELANKYLR